MLKYEHTGMSTLFRAIDKLGSGEELDLGEIRVTQIEDRLFMSSREYARSGARWFISIGTYTHDGFDLYSNYDLYKEVEKFGYEKEGLRWIGHLVLGWCTLQEEKKWLIEKLEIEMDEYDDSLWNREHAIEYALWYCKEIPSSK